MGRINPGVMSSDRDDWETPKELFDRCDSIWHFDLDVASSDENALCERHFTKDDDALKQGWGGVHLLAQSSLRFGNRSVRGEGGDGVAKAGNGRRGHASGANRHPMVVGLGGAVCG